MAYTPGKGTKLQLSISSVFTDIATVQNVTPPSMTMGESETTHLGSAAREFIPNIRDSGEVSFKIEYDAANVTHQNLLATYNTGVTADWKIIFPDLGTTEVTFSGFITGFSWDEVSVDNVVTASLTIKLTGTVSVVP